MFSTEPTSAAIKLDINDRVVTEIRRATPTVIIEDNKIANIGQNYSILAGMKLVLKCPAAGDPKPDILWMKNGKVIAENVESLVFKHATDFDDGEYTCKATNVFGTQEVSSKVVVMSELFNIYQ